MSWKTQGLYVWRTRKPHAILGLGLRWLVPAAVVLAWILWAAGEAWWPLAFLLPLFSGRHTAYVGMTGSRYFRDEQHIKGSYRWGSKPKPWADLAPKCYPLPCLFPKWEWARKVQEPLWIWLLLPVYPVDYNTKNPRRIKPRKAELQRYMRDANPWLKWGHRAVRFAFGCVVLAGAAYALLA